MPILPRLRIIWVVLSISVSVAESTLESVIEYVTKQDEHHRRLTFQEEYRAFLHRHHVNFDERYVWD